jgi:DNA-binding transcriptional regulator YiaG
LEIKLFNELLKQATLTKKEFASLVSMDTNSVVNWNTKGKTPGWVESWLRNYIRARAAEDAARLLIDAGF